MRRRTTGLAAAAAVAVAVVITLVALPTQHAPPPSAPGQQPPPRAEHQRADPPQAKAPPPALPAAPTAEVEAAPPDAWQDLKAWLGLAERDPVVLDLCGVGRMTIPKPAPNSRGELDSMALLPSHLGVDAQERAWETLLTRLDAGPPRWRAAAMLMRDSDATGQPAAAALRQLAQESNEPAIAFWALQRCRQDDGCRAETAGRWQQLEPDNLAAWLETSGGPAVADEARLARMAQARQHRQHDTALTQVMLEATANDAPSYLQPGLWMRAIGIQAAFSLSAFHSLAQMCPAKMAPDAANRPLCAAIAETLVERSDTLLAHSVGLRLAERTYMSKADAAERRASMNALTTQPVAFLPDRMPTSCANVEHLRAMIARTAQLGELGGLRAQAAERAASTAQATPGGNPQQAPTRPRP